MSEEPPRHEYPVKRRRENRWKMDPETGRVARDAQDRPTRRFIFTELYEWEAADGTRYRSPDPSVLDRRRLQHGEAKRDKDTGRILDL